jgi:16S rRNA (uracil1498-N3)-methyltransferase
VTRLFVPRTALAGESVEIGGPELRHLRTLRLGPGDEVVVFDDTGTEHRVRLERVERGRATGRVVERRTPARESPLDLVLAPALVKGPRMDAIIEKATELGVRAIAPVFTRRCVPERGHVARWRRIAVAAAKQSGRTAVPTIDDPQPLARVLAAPWPGVRLVAWEAATASGWDALPARADAVVALLGPEGGFAADEAAAALQAGFRPVTHGPRVLRAETAAIVLAALCQHRWGDGAIA